ncbi:MAG: hypothetical protein WA210_12835 [Burkholderiaceae bacterium]
MATIFDSIRPVQMPDPIEQQGRLYQLMALQDRAETGQLQREQMKRAMAKEGRLAQIMGQVNGDAELAAPLLYKEGLFNEANTILKGRREADSAAVDMNKKRAEAALQNLDLVGRVLGTVVDNPTPDRAAEAVRYIKSLNPAAPVSLPENGDIRGWAQSSIDAMLTAKDRMGKFGAPVQGVQNGVPVFVQPNQMGGAPRVMEGVTPPENDEFAKALRAAGIDPTSPQGRQLAMDYLKKKTTHQPATNISVNTEKSLLTNVAEGAAKEVTGAMDQARGAVTTIGQVQNLVAALKSGNVNVGPGADYRQTLDRIGVTLGVAGANAAERLQNTTQVVKSLAAANLDGAKALQGQGAVTDFERKLVERAASGDLNMAPQELMSVARVMDMAARSRIRTAQQYSRTLQGNPQAASIAPFLNVEMPPEIKFDAPSPAAQTKAWQIQKVE